LFCPKCGTQLQEDKNFCPNCGNQLAPPINLTVNIPQEKKPSKIPIKIIALAASIIILSCFLYKMFNSNTPVKVVEKFIAAMNDSDVNEAVSYLDPKYERLYKASSKLISKLVGTPEITDIAEVLPGFMELSGGKENSEITIEKVLSEKIEGSSATVRVRLKIKEKDTNGNPISETDTGTFILKKISGKWKIEDIR